MNWHQRAFLTHKQSSATLQPGLNDVASIVPVTVASWGGTQRKVPMGAAAYGMPLNEATPSEHTPCTSSPWLPGRATTQLADSPTRARSARPTARMSTLTSTVIMTRTVSRRGRVLCEVSFAFRVSLCVLVCWGWVHVTWCMRHRTVLIPASRPWRESAVTRSIAQ